MRSTNWNLRPAAIRQRGGLAQVGVATWLVGLALLSGFSLVGWQPRQEKTQEQDDPPPRGAVQEEEENAEAPPRGLRGIGRLRGPIQMQFNQILGGGPNGVSYSRSSNNGVTTTVMKEGDQEIKLEETPDGIFLEIGRSYTRKDVDELKTTHPELAKALEAFPTIADGNDVELSVRAVKKYEAVNEEDLKEEHPEAYEHYQKLVKMGEGGFSSDLGGQFFGGEMDLPGIQEIREQHERMRREMERMFEGIR
jgi:hypothetical protein